MRDFATMVLCLLLVAPVSASELRIAVASNFAPALKQIKSAFEKQFNVSVIMIKGSTGKLFAQIVHGAPYDIFMAADSYRPAVLEQKKLITSGSRYTYAIGQIALWAPTTNTSALQSLNTQAFKRLAIANPKTAPYGKAAIEVMQHLKVYKQNRNKLVLGENVAQVFQFIQSGNVQLGFIAYPDVNRHKIKHYWLPEIKTYTPLNQQLVILKRSDKQQLAKRFTQFLQHENTQHTIKQHGYLIP